MTVSDDDIAHMIDDELLARRTKVMFLRNAGATWAKIAEECGVSIATVRKDMEIVRRDINNEQPMDVVARHRAVIFDIQRANYPAMMRGDKDAAATILRALERESKLLGLDSPTRILASVSKDEFNTEAARLIDSILSKDADTLRELTYDRTTPGNAAIIDAEIEPEPEPVERERRSPFAARRADPARLAIGAGEADAPVDDQAGRADADGAGEGQDDRDGAAAAARQGGADVARRASADPFDLPDDDDDWSNI